MNQGRMHSKLDRIFLAIRRRALRRGSRGEVRGRRPVVGDLAQLIDAGASSLNKNTWLLEPGG